MANTTNSVKGKLEIKKLLKENWVLTLTIITLIISVADSFNIRKFTIPDFSKSNNLIPHTTETIKFKGEGTTGVKFWYKPKDDKNQGYKMHILEDYYVIIKSTHDVKISILDSEGDYIPLVSFMDKNWVFQSPKDDIYTIVFGGNTQAQITIDIPPLSKEENIMEKG